MVTRIGHWFHKEWVQMVAELAHVVHTVHEHKIMLVLGAH